MRGESNESRELLDNQRKKRSFMKLGLSFHEDSIEQAYKNFILGYKKKYFQFFQLVVLIAVSTNWIINPLNAENFSGRLLILNLIQIILHILAALYLFYKKDFKYPELGIFILQIYTCVGFIESSYQKNAILFSKSNYITTSTLLEMNSVVSMISRSSWKTNLVSSAFLNSYLCLRYADIKDNQEMKGLPAIVFFGNFLIMSLGSYFHERYDRELFFQRFNSEQSLKRFEEIIREVLPSSILIYKGEELKFFNKETGRMFNINNTRALEEKLKDITITSSENHYTTEENKIGVTEFTYEKDEPFINEIKKENNILLYFSKLLISVNKKGFIRMTGIIGNSGKQISMGEEEGCWSNKETKYLEIKIGRLSWEGNDAIMIIITESLAMQKLRHAQERVNYMDKLLATVSHDLRTPLNGVIGILDLLMENFLEKEFKKR